MHFLTSPDRQRAGFALSRCVRLVPRIIKPCCSLFPVSFPTLCCLCRASSALPSSCCQARQKPAARSHGAYGSRADRLTAGHGKGSGCPSCPCAVLSSPWRRFRPGPQSSSLSPPLNFRGPSPDYGAGAPFGRASRRQGTAGVVRGVTGHEAFRPCFCLLLRAVGLASHGARRTGLLRLAWTRFGTTRPLTASNRLG
jgi:hypothetical protein